MADAMIWGASGGMGRALVQTLVKGGWRVFAAARDESKIPDGAYRTYPFAAGDARSIQNIAVDLAQETDGFDFWGYIAGELQADLLRKMSPDSWHDVLNSNLTGAFTSFSQTNHFINDNGQVAFIGAYVDHLILPKMGAYAVAKAGLETLAQVLQKEHRKLNFTVVKPGAVDTPFWENAPFKMPASAKSPQVVVDALLAWTKASKKGTLEL
jgi:NAD(P)-dependent dehydrogenase (short-subunit alcohol dehydrogenase family)